MNDVVEVEQKPATGVQQGNPGALLRDAREALGWSQQDVADKLHLKRSFVNAIETHRYSQLPGETFIRGYLRSYARLVDIAEKDVINRLNVDFNIKDEVDNSEPAPPKKSAPVLFAVLALGVVAAVVFFLVQPPSPAPSDLGTVPLPSAPQASPELSPTPTVTEDTDETAASGSAPESREDDADTDTTPEPATPVQSDAAVPVANDEPIADAVIDAPSVDDTPVASSPEPVAAPEVAEEVEQSTVVADAADAAAALPEATLSVVFSDQCWFELFNGTGERAVIGLKEAGDTVEYTGPAPFRVVVGKVSAAALVFNGELVEFTANQITRNTARLTLGL